MTELKAILLITVAAMLAFLIIGALLYIAVKIMMADEFDGNDFLSDFHDKNDNSDDD